MAYTKGFIVDGLDRVTDLLDNIEGSDANYHFCRCLFDEARHEVLAVARVLEDLESAQRRLSSTTVT